MEKLNVSGSSPYFGIASGYSRAFQQFIKDLGEAKSKHDEDTIITRELAKLKESSTKPSVSLREKKENMTRLIYGHILGHDVSFGYVYVIKLAEQSNLLEKRVGYLTLSLLLSDTHELTLLLMNTILKDLQSKNLLTKSFGLSAASRLVSKSMMPMVLGAVKELVHHSRDVIRKKAISLLCRFFLLDPCRVELYHILHGRLSEHDPGVLGAVINGYLILVKKDRLQCKSLTAPLVSIVKQIIERRIPQDSTYSGVPAPWVLITGLQVLAELGADDLSASQEMYAVLGLCLEKITVDSIIGCAVTFECMKTILAIYPDPFMISMVATRLSVFFVAKNNNMKYIGINMLGRLISIDMKYAEGYQTIVIDSLNESDETLKRETLELLYKMTNSGNVDVVCNKLLTQLRSTVDAFFRTNLVARITKLAERFAPNDLWYLKTMNDVMEIAGNLLNPEIAYNVMRLIGEGPEDEEMTEALVNTAVLWYMELINKPTIPDILTQLAVWVIGEYACSSGIYKPDDVLDQLYSLLDKKYSDKYTQNWIISAIIKVYGQMNEVPNDIVERLCKCSKGMDSDFKQRCSEAIGLYKMNVDWRKIFPVDASCEDIKVESSLEFLDGISRDCIAKGAPAYNPEWKMGVRESMVDQEEPCQVNFAPYQRQIPEWSVEEYHRRETFKVETEETGRNADVISEGGKPKLWTARGYLLKENQRSQSSELTDSSSEDSFSEELETSIIYSTVEDNKITNVQGNDRQPYLEPEKKQLVEALFGRKEIHTKSADVVATNFKQKSKAAAQTFSEGNFTHLEVGKVDIRTETVDSLAVDDLLLYDHYDRYDALTPIPSTSTSLHNSRMDHKQPLDTLNATPPSDPTPEPDIDKENVDSNFVKDADVPGQNFLKEDLVFDENVRLSLVKELKPAELCFQLFIKNQTSNSIHHLKLSIKDMSNLDLRLIHSEDLTLHFDAVSPRRMLQCTLSIQYKAPAQNLAITGDVSYRDKSNTHKLLLFRHELTHLDFVRPLSMEASEFESRWLTVGLLEFFKVSQCGNINADRFLELLGSAGHIHLVDEERGIETEVLAAATMLGKTAVLFYFKIKTNSIEVRMRSDNSSLNQVIFNSLESRIIHRLTE